MSNIADEHMCFFASAVLAVPVGRLAACKLLFTTKSHDHLLSQNFAYVRDAGPLHAAFVRCAP